MFSANLRAFIILGLLFALNAISNPAIAQGMGSCPMCGSMGWVGMILGSILILALIAALVALAVFLIRRSHT